MLLWERIGFQRTNYTAERAIVIHNLSMTIIVSRIEVTICCIIKWRHNGLSIGTEHCISDLLGLYAAQLD